MCKSGEKMYKVDLNCDLGESFGNYKIGHDAEVIKLISSANIACGFHASDPLVMANTVQLAQKAGVAVGAHPGFPDLVGFGRRNMNVSLQEAKAMVQYQIGALNAFCTAQNIKMQHVKPHGALYNMAAKDFDLARAICEGIYEINADLILLGLSGSQLVAAANSVGLQAANEVFADRAYKEDGTLLERSKAGAVIADEDAVIQRVVRMITEHKVQAVTGIDIPIQADSICVHGDGSKALEFVKKISRAFTNEQIQMEPLR